jgi:hypothetical protein
MNVSGPIGSVACVYVEALIREAGEQGVRGGQPLRSELPSLSAFCMRASDCRGRSARGGGSLIRAR